MTYFLAKLDWARTHITRTYHTW